MSPPLAYPAWIDTLWGQAAGSATIPQDTTISALPVTDQVLSRHDGLASTTGFNGPMGPGGHGHTLLPVFRDPITSTSRGQPWHGYPPMQQPDYGVVVNAPGVIRHTIGTPAILSSANMRRKHPRNYFCHICGNRFTSKANRDREFR